MRWSKLRHSIKARFAPELKHRMDIHSAAYGACTCGHAWVTWDGEVIANFCTRAKFIREGYEPGAGKPNTAWNGQLAQFGEFSRQNAYQACWAFLHDLSIDDALQDDDPLINFLAICDARMGKRRLKGIDPRTLHPLAARIFALRMEVSVPAEARQVVV